jgi:hypothetical protein
MTKQEKQTAERGQPNGKRRNRQRPMPAANAFTYTVEDGMMMGLPGKTTVYAMIKDGRLQTINVGGRTMLTGESVRRVLGVKEEVAA